MSDIAEVGVIIDEIIYIVSRIYLLCGDLTWQLRRKASCLELVKLSILGVLLAMMSSTPSTYPPELSPAQSDYLLSNVKDWSILNGLAVRPSEAYIPKETDSTGSLAVTAPVTLFPSLFPKDCFEEARAIQVAYNELYALIASDEHWLGKIVEEYANECFAISVTFTRKILQSYKCPCSSFLSNLSQTCRSR